MPDEQENLRRILTNHVARTDLFAPEGIPIRPEQDKSQLLRHALETSTEPWALRVASSAPRQFLEIASRENPLPKISFRQQRIEKHLPSGPQHCILPRLFPLNSCSNSLWKYCYARRQRRYHLCKWEETRFTRQALLFLPRQERLKVRKPRTQLLLPAQLRYTSPEIPYKPLPHIHGTAVLNNASNIMTGWKREEGFIYRMIRELLDVGLWRIERATWGKTGAT